MLYMEEPSVLKLGLEQSVADEYTRQALSSASSAQDKVMKSVVGEQAALLKNSRKKKPGLN